MQHTETYNLNIIETSDTFSPEALNENAQKLEDALVTHEAVVDTALKAQKLEWQAADSALDGKLSALDTAKAEKTTLAAETAARESALATLSARVGTLERDRLRFKLGTYTGAGVYGKDNPNRLEFDFKPIALIVCHPMSNHYGSYLWLKPTSVGRSYLGPSGSTYDVAVTWEDRAVQWFLGATSGSDQFQLNGKSTSYLYLAFGTEE